MACPWSIEFILVVGVGFINFWKFATLADKADINDLINAFNLFSHFQIIYCFTPLIRVGAAEMTEVKWSSAVRQWRFHIKHSTAYSQKIVPSKIRLLLKDWWYWVKQWQYTECQAWKNAFCLCQLMVFKFSSVSYKQWLDLDLYLLTKI